MRGMFEYGVLTLNWDFISGAITWSMLGPVGSGVLVTVVPVQSPAIPPSWEAMPAAATLSPSSTVTWLVKSTCIGPALVKADKVSRKTRGFVTLGVVPVGAGPCAPHLKRTQPQDVKRRTR